MRRRRRDSASPTGGRLPARTLIPGRRRCVSRTDPMNNSIEGLDRIALTHDYLDQYGGAERTLARICDRFRTAPLYTSVYDRPAMRRLGFVEPAQRIVVSFMQTLPLRKRVPR